VGLQSCAEASAGDEALSEWRATAATRRPPRARAHPAPTARGGANRVRLVVVDNAIGVDNVIARTVIRAK